jgi:hypothetical protein
MFIPEFAKVCFPLLIAIVRGELTVETGRPTNVGVGVEQRGLYFFRTRELPQNFSRSRTFAQPAAAGKQIACR